MIKYHVTSIDESFSLYVSFFRSRMVYSSRRAWASSFEDTRLEGRDVKRLGTATLHSPSR